MSVAVCVLTLNEEKNLEICLETIFRYFDDVHVVDSGSTDNTLTLARNFECKIYHKKQNGRYSAASQRNWAIKNIESNADWVLFVDADELLVDGFRRHIVDAINTNKYVDVLSVPLLYHFHGKCIFSMGYPNWHDRVVRRNVRFNSSVGEYILTENRLYLKDAVIKHNFNSLGMIRFVEKQARYADYIGMETFKYLNGNESEYFNKGDGNASLKRKVAKLGIFRPFLRFIYQFFIKKGFLEGKEGFIVAIYMSIFEFLVVVSEVEYERSKKGKIL